MNFTTIRTVGSNETTIETTTILNNHEKLPQCDYSLLFSHLPLSFQFIQQQTLLQPMQATTDTQSQYQQQSTYKLCFALVCLLFGLFYSLFGYRFLKVSTFMIGFSLGSSVIYLILSEQKQLSLVENLIISLSIGVLFAFVALLVQYIGLFLLGITSSTSIVTCILIVIDLFYTNKSAWLCIGLLFICATIIASFTLKFQKSFTILNTSCIGCGLLLIAIDFFVENNLLIDYIYELYKVNGNSFNMFERQKALLKSSNDFLTTTIKSSISSTTTTTTTTTTSKLSSLFVKPFASIANNGSDVNNPSNSALALFLHLYSSAHARLCWYTWLIFGSYFLLLILSLLIQFLLTGKNYDHRDSWHKWSRKKKSANLEKIRLKSHLNEGGNSHHHHHHHHHNTNDNTLNNHVNQDLISNESSLSRQHSDLEGSSQNDTLLLVESGTACASHKNKINTVNYTVSSTSENATVLCNKQNNQISASKSGNGHRRHHKSSKSGEHGNSKKENEGTSLEIVSFEVLTSPKNNKKDKSKSKSKQTSTQKAPSKQKENFISASTSTTTSTSSSSSSTCQLIPIKLNNNDTNTSTTTKTTSTEVNSTAANIHQHPPLSPKLQPSAPPISLINSTTPPPVPSLPPPKLPLSLIAQTTISNSSTVSNLILNPPPTVVNKNLSKLKPHRSASKDKEINSKDKFRYFYQIRRNNGDVLSQDFMNNIQNKLSSSNNINANNTNESGSINSNTRSSSLSSSDKKSKKN